MAMENKEKISTRRKEHFYKAAQETLKKRSEDKLIGKVTWFKTWGRRPDSIFRGTT